MLALEVLPAKTNTGVSMEMDNEQTAFEDVFIALALTIAGHDPAKMRMLQGRLRAFHEVRTRQGMHQAAATLLQFVDRFDADVELMGIG